MRVRSELADDEQTLEEAYQKLRAYTALHHRIRIRAIFLIVDNPGISFNDLVRRTKVPASKLAYHIALLGSGDLIVMKHERKGKVTSHYFVTELGEKMDIVSRAGLALPERNDPLRRGPQG